MKLICPSCGAPIAGEDISLAQGRAVCRPCGEVITLDGARAPAVPRPTDLRCSEARDGERASWTLTPSRLQAAGTGLFAIFWCAFLVVWYAKALAHPSQDSTALWFPLLHVGMGGLLVWATLRGLLNRTVVTIDRDRFSLQEGPIPAFNSAGEASANIERFEPARRSAAIRGRGQRDIASLRMVTRDGRAVMLKLSLDRDDHAQWLATRWNEALAKAQVPAAPLTYRG